MIKVHRSRRLPPRPRGARHCPRGKLWRSARGCEFRFQINTTETAWFGIPERSARVFLLGSVSLLSAAAEVFGFDGTFIISLALKGTWFLSTRN